MRKVIYLLDNGTKATTLLEAQGYNGKYEAVLVEVEREKIKHSPIRKDMLNQYGYVHKSLYFNVRSC